ncbi:MAG: nuclear transport factor 2 family protein [Myxococcales bacterium]|nr:nuclear transport factor 2 family protein [Myxococcales bacterium]
MPRIVLALALIGCVHARPSAADVVQRQLEAYNARDIHAFAATYSDDVLVTGGNGNGVVLGIEGLRDRYGKAFTKMPDVRCRVAERKTEGENVVLDHEICTGWPGKPDPWDVGWVRYEVRDGKIKSVQLP